MRLLIKYFKNGVLLYLLSLGIYVEAQVTTPKYSNEFLSIGVSARALSMGNAQTAIVDDATAGYWNPAGLLEQKHKYNASLMHSELMAGIVKNDYLGFSTPIDSASFLGISIIRTAVDDIPNTLNLVDQNGTINYDNISYFSVADYGFLISYAKRSNLIKGLKLGANAKIIYRQVGPFATAWGFGLDAGAQLKRKEWLLGAMLRDATSTPTAWFHNTDLVTDAYLQTGNEIPENSIELAMPRLLVGIARNIKIKNDFNVLPSFEVEMTTDGKRNVLVRSDFVSIDPKLGLECSYKSLIFIRSGINNIQQIEDFSENKSWVVQPNFGIGLKINRFTLDYALSKISTGDDALFSHIFSLKLYVD